MTQNAIEMNGACHCGTVRFRATLADGLNTARRCNCSLCRMRGAVAVTATAVEVTEGQDALTLYQFNTKVAKHYFCSHCGIYTHHQRRSDPKQIGVNVACLEGVSPFDFSEVQVNDGINHPSDSKTRGSSIAGVLKYTANDQ